ncbi:hypothetical protein [Anaplasma phagocytophilum]|uniref:Uncharacterized protein n=2 Tax=Anaplasma phagocytophilum TaxID=948 RepID=Q2GJR3_ANAPZ|nr:hypothetical protein [Anaplasma phagocytophilum]ABD43977.1 hypothetical protein APH_0811 [Anaplasma phagocytophilum str. HZ]AGR79487.1 hypothetical protein YYU_03770 [Anaplasma phagocytophilum str. HZ2]KJV63115.1 hypothetical protein EPHNCH_1132 [Anaplasma phagocytophilum str. NCH-1]KJV86977.1 hypothetical protein APHNYW_0823 [Anaplasma phagocytophilum str. ApNYW]
MHPGSGDNRRLNTQRHVSDRVSSGSYISDDVFEQNDVPTAESSSVNRNANSRRGGASERVGYILRAFRGLFSRHRSAAKTRTDSEKPRDARKGKGHDTSSTSGLCCIPSSQGKRRTSSGTTTTRPLGSKTDAESSRTTRSKSAVSSRAKSVDHRKEESDDLDAAVLAAAECGNGIPPIVPDSAPCGSSSFIRVRGSFPGYSSAPSMGVVAARIQGIPLHNSSDTLRALRRLHNTVKNLAADMCDESNVTSTRGLCCIPSSQSKRTVSSEATRGRYSSAIEEVESGNEGPDTLYEQHVRALERAVYNALRSYRLRRLHRADPDPGTHNHLVQALWPLLDEQHVRALERAVYNALRSCRLRRLHRADPDPGTHNHLVQALWPLLELARTEIEKSDSQPTKRLITVEDAITQLGDCLNIMQSSQKGRAIRDTEYPDSAGIRRVLFLVSAILADTAFPVSPDVEREFAQCANMCSSIAGIFREDTDIYVKTVLAELVIRKFSLTVSKFKASIGRYAPLGDDPLLECNVYILCKLEALLERAFKNYLEQRAEVDESSEDLSLLDKAEYSLLNILNAIAYLDASEEIYRTDRQQSVQPLSKRFIRNKLYCSMGAGAAHSAALKYWKCCKAEDDSAAAMHEMDSSISRVVCNLEYAMDRISATLLPGTDIPACVRSMLRNASLCMQRAMCLVDDTVQSVHPWGDEKRALLPLLPGECHPDMLLSIDRPAYRGARPMYGALGERLARLPSSEMASPLPSPLAPENALTALSSCFFPTMH